MIPWLACWHCHRPAMAAWPRPGWVGEEEGGGGGVKREHIVHMYVTPAAGRTGSARNSTSRFPARRDSRAVGKGSGTCRRKKAKQPVQNHRRRPTLNKSAVGNSLIPFVVGKGTKQSADDVAASRVSGAKRVAERRLCDSQSLALEPQVSEMDPARRKPYLVSHLVLLIPGPPLAARPPPGLSHRRRCKALRS